MDSPTLFMVGAAILALTCLLYLVQSSRVTMLGYQVQDVQNQQVEVARRAGALEYEIGLKEDLAGVERHAREKLQMHRTEEYVYLRVRVSPADLRAAESLTTTSAPPAATPTERGR